MHAGDLFRVKIILPSQNLVDKEVSMVTLQSEEGMIGILKNHKPLIVNLTNGVVIIHELNDKSQYYISGGVANVTNQSLVVLTDFAIDLSEQSRASIEEKVKDFKTELEMLDDETTDAQLLKNEMKKYQTALEFIE